MIFFSFIDHGYAHKLSNRSLNLEQTINHKIKQAREEMHTVQGLTKSDNLWIKVETLQWVLDQILISNNRILKSWSAVVITYLYHLLFLM